MEGFMISPYNFGQYSGCGPIYHGNPKFKPHWAKKGGLYVPPDTLDYLDLCKRAQLKAILSQINPNLTPRLRKANTKEFGVQVNSKVDAVVQCSLGPKTLFYRERTFPSFPKSPIKSPALSTPDGKVLPSTPVNNVRFSRPLAIYSPVFDRRFFAMSLKSNDSSACEDGEQDGNHFGDDAEADRTTEVEGATEDTREDVRKPLQPPVPKGFNFQASSIFMHNYTVVCVGLNAMLAVFVL